MISENSIKGPMPATTSFMLTVHFIFNNLPPPFFFYLSLLSRTFTIHRTAGNGEGISLTPLYHFHPLHRHLDISWATTAESSPLHIASSRTMCRGELSAVIARLIFSFQDAFANASGIYSSTNWLPFTGVQNPIFKPKNKKVIKAA